jgi:hypothetical protein
VNELLAQVGTAIRNARENGYAEVDTWTPSQLASDMAEHDADLERVPLEVLEAAVVIWRWQENGG